jgi:hypothetical protein
MTTSTFERVYIAGPMTGLPDFNHPAFHAAAARLRSLQFEVVSPAELHINLGKDWLFYVRAGIAALTTCDSIYMLEGWDKSRGAQLEWDIASRLGLSIYYTGDI